jgi:hypothetical protein
MIEETTDKLISHSSGTHAESSQAAYHFEIIPVISAIVGSYFERAI